MPAGLAELPRPHLPASALPAWRPSHPPAAPGQPPAGAPEQAQHPAGHEEEMPAHEGAHRAVVALLAGAMPWLLSACLHAGALVILLFAVVMVPVIQGQKEPPRVEEAAIIDNSTFEETNGSLKGTTDGVDATVPQSAVQTGPKVVLPEGPSKGWAKADTGEKTIGKGWGLAPKEGAMEVFGFGSNGGGGAGGVDAFGLSRGGGVGKAAFYGVTSPKYRAGGVCYVIFVIDKSGSVVGSFDDIRQQLIDSICQLKAPQQFHVVFFSGDKCEQLQPGRMVLATEDNKLAALKSLGAVRASGFGSSPIPALEVAFRAFRNTPDNRGKLLYLLTDGEFDSSGYQYRGPDGKPLMGNQAVIGWLHDNNKTARVHVCPIILGPRPSVDTEASIQRLADENGGRYKYVPNAN
jgi:hypothetical protein